METKYDKGLCRWPKCKEPSIGGKPTDFENDQWILPLYCKKHGKNALKNRKHRILRGEATEYKKQHPNWKEESGG